MSELQRHGVRRAPPLRGGRRPSYLSTAPAFFPRELLTPALRDVSQYNPLTYVVEAVRGLLAGDSALGDPLAGLAAALALALATTALATFALARRLRAL